MALTTIDDRGLKTPIDLLDSEKIRFGTGSDLQIYHDGTNSVIEDVNDNPVWIQTDGAIRLTKDAAAEYYATFNPDGAVELYYDGVKKLETTASGIAMAGVENAGAQLKIGASNDIQIEHDGSNSYITNATGNLELQSDSVLKLRSKTNGPEEYIVCTFNGAVELYYNNSKKLETISTGVQINGNLNVPTGDVQLNDNKKLRLGNSQDLDIYHDGSHSYIKDTGASHLKIENDNIRMRNGAGDELMFTATVNDSVSLYYDNSKKFETTTSGATVTGSLLMESGHIYVQDGYEVKFGADDDLKIYHDGSHSHLVNSTGDLRIDSDRLELRANGGEAFFTGTENGAVELYYDNEKRIETSGIGAKISHDGNTSLQLYDNSANSVSNWITAKTAGHAEYNCYKEGVGTAYPHVFVGYTTEYARIDAAGIKFNGDTAAANGLDDYEEGTWTPYFANVSAPTYSNQSGRYTKIGRYVFCTGIITVSSGLDNSDGSTINVSGIPISGNSDGEVCLFTMGRYTSLLPQAALDDYTSARFGGTYVMLMNGNNTGVDYSDCNSSGIFSFSFAYTT